MARDQRRLAAIVSADVVAYSRLMGRDESGTLAALKAHRRELIDPKISEHDGRIVKTMGDGLLLEFSSVVDAVRCAVEVQRGMAERNVSVPADERIDFRIGINVGDIIIDGDDIFGDGVNIAARLQALAEPGGICVSKVVRDQVLDKLSFTFEDLGAQEVKNIARPVEAYRVAFEGERLQAATGPKRRPLPIPSIRSRWVSGGILAAALVGIAVWQLSQSWKAGPAPMPPPYSIAVLPLSAGGASEEQFADRLTRDLTSALGRAIRYGPVASPGAVAIYKGKPIDARRVGGELNVRYLLEGEVRRAGEQVAVNVQILDTLTTAELWSDREEIEQARLEQNEGAFAGRVAIRVRYALDRAEERRAAAPPGSGASAAYLASHAYAVWSRDDNTLSGALEARKWFDEALKKDPDSVQALIGRVRTLQYELDLNPRADRDRLIQEMDQMTFRAVSIDPNSPAGWTSRGFALENEWRWDAALQAYANAQNLDPYTGGPLNSRAGIMIYTGQPAEAFALIDQQLARGTPTKEALGWAMLQRCRANMALGRYDEAIEACERDVALDNWWLPHAYLVAAYAQKGETAKASAEKSALLKLRPGFSIADFKARRFSDNEGFLQQTEAHLYTGLRKAGIPEQ